MAAEHYYGITSGTMNFEKQEKEYEITINGTGVEFGDDVILQDGINIAIHFKGSIYECFPAEDTSK
jgi:hypothetical protein